MATISVKPKVDVVINFTINEAEARALDALVGYGDDAFIKQFKEFLGDAYIRGHENGLREFFKTIRVFIPPILSRLNDARKTFEK